MVYGVLGACSGANINLKNEEKLKVPGTNAVFHPVWTGGLFVLTTGKALLEVEASKRSKIIKEAAANAGFALAVGTAAYFYGPAVGLAIGAAFVASRLFTAGDNSPLEHLKG